MNRDVVNMSARAAMLAACVGLASSASAAVPLEKIIENTDAIPGVTVGPGLTATWIQQSNGAFAGGSSGTSIDNLGRVIFRGQLVGTGIVTTGTATVAADNFGVWHGTPGMLSLVARTGSVNPANDPAGLIIANNATTLGNGLTNISDYSLSPSGKAAFAARVNDTAAVSSSLRSAVWSGNIGSMNKVALSGSATFADLAPGTAGAKFSTQGTDAWDRGSINNAGQVLFGSSLTGGDTVTSGVTANSSAQYVGSSYGTLTQVWRTGTTTLTGAGVTPNATLNSTGGVKLNGGGFVGGTGILRQGSGDVPVGDLQDGVILTNHGGTLRTVAQEGGSAPTLPGVTFATAAGSPFFGPGTPFQVGSQYFNNNGRTLYLAGLGGAVTAGVDDAAYFVHNGVTNTTARAFRRGESASSLVFGATFGNVPSTFDSRLNNNNKIAFVADLTGAAVTSADNNVLWIRSLGTSSNTLVMREGFQLDGLDQRTDLFGVKLGAMSGLLFNNSDTIVFTTTLTGAGVTTANDRAIFAWDEVGGLTLILREGDNLGTNGSGVSSLANFVASSFGYQSGGNSEGGSLGLSDGNWLSLTVLDNSVAASRNSMVVRVKIPAPGAAGLLALGGLIAARRRRS